MRGTKSNKRLITLGEAEGLGQREVVKLYRRHVNPGIATFMALLGFDKLDVVRAEGLWLYTSDGRRILDFSGGMNVLNHGHNHPRILDVRRRFAQKRRLEVCKAVISRYEAVLAHNMAAILGHDFRYSFFCTSGAEANEGAMKLALVYWWPMRSKIIYTDLGYHGKTFGTMSVSGPASKPYKEYFKRLDGCIEVPYGDLRALENALAQHSRCGRCDVAAMILEPIKGDLAVLPPPGYLEGLVGICHKYGVLVIFDEIFTCFGRTGKWFAFQHYNVFPDIVTYSKSLGGGKAAIAGYTAREHVFKKAYGPLSRCTIHTSTFSSMGEACATAIEALNVIAEEGLLEAATEKGKVLRERMEALVARYPHYLSEARSIGLLGVLSMRKAAEVLGLERLRRFAPIDDWLEGLLPAVVTAKLLKEHDILIYTGGREDNLFINPALVVTEEEMSLFFERLEHVLQQDLVREATLLLENLLKALVGT